jgi:hypothetical protein
LLFVSLIIPAMRSQLELSLCGVGVCGVRRASPVE